MTRPLLCLALVLSAAAVTGSAHGQVEMKTPGMGTATVEFLDVGQGDAILIRTSQGKTALIDAGPSKSIVETLRRRGVQSLDLLVISHHHIDHYGGANDVVRAFKPRVFLAAAGGHTTPTYLRLLELIRDRGITAIAPTDKPRKVNLGSVTLTILPQPPPDDDENNNSIGIRVQHGDISVLLTGDSEATERAWWMRNCPALLTEATVLKLAHHGSSNGTDRDWLRAIRPKLAVVSAGAGNPFGHPSLTTLTLLSAHRIPLYRTDRDGTVEIRSDGKRFELDGAPKGSRGPPVEKPPARPTGQLVNLNTATQAELEALPGIGPTLARRIIEARPFRSVEGLGDIKGIGPKKLGDLRPLVAAP